MCTLCDKIRSDGWNFCPICGKELRIPKYNLDDTLEDLLKKVSLHSDNLTFRERLERAAIEHKAVLDYLADK